MCSYKVLDKSSHLIPMIEKFWPPKTFQKSFSVFYEGQIPNVAIFVHDGFVKASSSIQGTEKIISGLSLIGFSELFQQNSSDCTIEIWEGSKVSIIDRPGLISAFEEERELSQMVAGYKLAPLNVEKSPQN